MSSKGTVTFLFTDVVGSTDLRSRLGDDAADRVFARHLRLLRDAVGACGGTEVKDLGDGLMAAFGSAADALRCSTKMQRAVTAAEDDIGLRVGVHTGETVHDAGDYHGTPVVIARRLCDRAEGGQILASQLFREVVGTRGGHAFRSVGSLKLKGIRGVVPACEIVWREGERGDEDLARVEQTPGAAPSRPARALTSFVGRVEELAKVQGLLSKHRLVTLTGPGGSGKTRLAVEVARELAGHFQGGAPVVELAPVTDPELVPGTVAGALGVREQPGVSVLESLTTTLAGRHLLLVLDNCEHLLDASGDVTEAILNASDDVRILATSREPLGIAGETRYAVPPLPVPPADPGVVPLHDYAAVGLFEERAQQADPEFALTLDSGPAVATLVRRLDGMPLAIELAAARVDVLGIDQLVEGLDEPLKILVSDSDRPASRQRSLEAATDWSYRLLSEPEQCLFRRLGMFAGPFSLEAARAVAGLDAERLVPRLVRCSLLTHPERGDDGVTRYRILETLRAYANQRLAESGEIQETRAHFAQWALTRAESVAGGFRGMAHLLPVGAGGHDESRAVDFMDAERDNLVSALDAMLENAPEQALRLALCLSPLWRARGRATDGFALLERALSSFPDAPVELRAAARVWLTQRVPDTPDSSLRTLELADELGPSPLAVDLMNGSAFSLLNAGAEDQAVARARNAIEMSESVNYPSGAAFANCVLGYAALYAGRFDDAVEAAEAAYGADPERLNYETADLRAELLADALCAAGDFDRAERVVRERVGCGGISARANEPDFLAILATIELQTGRRQEAAAHLSEAIRIASEENARLDLSNGLEFAGVCVASEHAEEAAMLWGASAAILDALGFGEVEDASMSKVSATAKSAVETELGAAKWADAQMRGAGMSMQEATWFARVVLDEAAQSGSAASAPKATRLSTRERELLGLVAEGLTNAQIGERLFISVKTVQSHLDRIRDKTGARRRPELTRLALELAASPSASG